MNKAKASVLVLCSHSSQCGTSQLLCLPVWDIWCCVCDIPTHWVSVTSQTFVWPVRVILSLATPW